MKALTGIAAAILTMILASAAQALPSPPTSFVPLAGGAVGFSDGVFVGRANAGILDSFTVNNADIASCSVPLIGGCFFVAPNPLGLPFNAAQEGKYTLVYEPDGVTISDIFGMNCDGQICGFAFLSKIEGQAIDLSSIITTGWYQVTEVAGAPSTIFDATYYLDPSYLDAHPGTFARFVSAETVPEPMTLTLFGAGLVGAVALRRRRKQA